jgi:putative spermidine/putrescine transport system permease protein
MANHASTSMTHSTIAGVVLVRAVYGLVIAA